MKASIAMRAMRTEDGRELIKTLAPGQWVTPKQILDLFGNEPEFRRQVLDQRPEIADRLSSRCSKRGIEVRDDNRLVQVGSDCRHAMGQMAASQARKVAQVDATALPDEKRRQAEGAMAFFSVTAMAAKNKELKGDAATRLLGGSK